MVANTGDSKLPRRSCCSGTLASNSPLARSSVISKPPPSTPSEIASVNAEMPTSATTTADVSLPIVICRAMYSTRSDREKLTLGALILNAGTD